MKVELFNDKNVNTDDLDEIYNKINWGGIRNKKGWKNVLEKSTFVTYAKIGDKVVAFGRCLDDSEMCMVYDICVHPEYQKKGLGKLIMQEIMKYINSNDFIKIQLFTFVDNPTLSTFYEKFGFEKSELGMGIIGPKLKRAFG